MHPAAARVDVGDVLEAEVVAQRGLEALDSHGHVGPALGANLGPAAARPHVVVIRQVDVKHKLTLGRWSLKSKATAGRGVTGLSGGGQRGAVYGCPSAETCFAHERSESSTHSPRRF